MNSTPRAALGVSEQVRAFGLAIIKLGGTENPSTSVRDEIRSASEAFGVSFADIRDAIDTGNALFRGLCDDADRFRPLGRKLAVVMRLSNATFSTLSLASAAHVDFNTLNPVTKLPGRARFERDLAELIAGAEALDAQLAVILADIDNLHDLNASEGYEHGDRALGGFATVARNECDREGVTAYHWGGDEFSLILKGAPVGEATAIIARLEETAVRIDSAGDQKQVGFSAAIAEFAVDGFTSNALVGAAGDRVQAIKRARRVGRDSAHH
jgi:diguanylate cyclase (GGDEF)-like protein